MNRIISRKTFLLLVCGMLMAFGSAMPCYALGNEVPEGMVRVGWYAGGDTEKQKDSADAHVGSDRESVSGTWNESLARLQNGELTFGLFLRGVASCGVIPPK